MRGHTVEAPEKNYPNCWNSITFFCGMTSSLHAQSFLTVEAIQLFVVHNHCIRPAVPL